MYYNPENQSGSAVILTVEQAAKNAAEQRNENQSGSWSGLPLHAPYDEFDERLEEEHIVGCNNENCRICFVQRDEPPFEETILKWRDREDTFAQLCLDLYHEASPRITLVVARDLVDHIRYLNEKIDKAGKEVGTALIHSNPSLVAEHLLKAYEILNGPIPKMHFHCNKCGSDEHDTVVCLKK